MLAACKLAYGNYGRAIRRAMRERPGSDAQDRAIIEAKGWLREWAALVETRLQTETGWETWNGTP